VEEITAGAPFREAACGVVSTLKCIVIEMGWQIKRIAVSHLTRRFRRRCPTGFAHEASQSGRSRLLFMRDDTVEKRHRDQTSSAARERAASELHRAVSRESCVKNELTDWSWVGFFCWRRKIPSHDRA